MKNQAIIGYLVLDDGLPVRSYDPYPPISRYWTSIHSHRAVSLFPDRKTAERVRTLLRRKYAALCNQFDPKVEEERSSYEHWLARTKSLRICCVAHDAPTAQELRVYPGGPA